jgi:Single Cache domain 2
MFRTLTIAVASAAVLALSPIAFAQQTGGTANEAKAMLMKAAAAVKENKTKAIDLFNRGEGGFLDRDLYVFCADLITNKQIANGNPNAKALIGTDLREAKDAYGKAFGAEIVDGMKKPEGEITEVNYVFPKPGSDKTPVPKISLVTKVSDDLGCGVGYYKQQ